MKALRCAGLFALFLADHNTARRHAEEGLAIAREHEPGYVVHLLDVLGHASGMAAQPIWEERVALARQNGDPALINDALNQLGKTLMFTDRAAEARPLLEEALDHAVRSQDRLYMMAVKGSIANLLEREGDIGEALRLYQEVTPDYRASGVDPHQLGYICISIGAISRSMGDMANARSHFGEALQWFQRLGDVRGVIVTWEMMAITECRMLSAHTPEEAQWAARLLGAADRQRELRNLIPPREDPPATTRHGREAIAQLRTNLGDEAFAVAWDEGRAMTLEEAIEYALQSQANL